MEVDQDRRQRWVVGIRLPFGFLKFFFPHISLNSQWSVCHCWEKIWLSTRLLSSSFGKIINVIFRYITHKQHSTAPTWVLSQMHSHKRWHRSHDYKRTQVFLSESSGFISCGISCRVDNRFRNQSLIPLNLCLLPFKEIISLKGGGLHC